MSASKRFQRIAARLAEIKEQAVGFALNPTQTDPLTAANLAEEAASLGLELLEEDA